MGGGGGRPPKVLDPPFSETHGIIDLLLHYDSFSYIFSLSFTIIIWSTAPLGHLVLDTGETNMKTY